MNRTLLLFTMVFVASFVWPCCAGVQVDGLRCEYATDPVGIDVLQPRLSWLLQSDQRGQKQTAYQILVAATTDTLADDKGDLWDSGKVVSDQSIHVEYGGKPLISRMRCYWKVRVWDRDGQLSAWSQPACWTMGLLQAKDWQGQWIGSLVERPERSPEERVGEQGIDAIHPPYAAVLLRKPVELSKPVTRATAYICGLGYYELYINGVKVGDHVLDPGFTDYTQRVEYVTYDVKPLLENGDNAVGVILGGGWYDTPAIDYWTFHVAPWIAPPKLLVQIELEFADGTRQSIVSDTTWKWSTGPIVFNSVRGGETYDARREKPGWDRPGYDDSQWAEARMSSGPKGRLVAQQHPPIRITQSIRPVALHEPKPGLYVFDLGVNNAGWAQLKTRGKQGQSVTLEFNEALNPDGSLNMKYLFDPGRNQVERFILKGEGLETFEPRFTYHGFRYVQVTGLSEKPSLDSLTGRWVHTDLESAGEFSCSNPLLNRVHEIIRRTQLCNVHGIPTDCPHREKIGWTCDGCVTMEEAIYNFNMASFYTKWFHDMLDGQDENGHAACIAPCPGWGRSAPDGSPFYYADPWWGGALVRAPWNVYRYYGDKRILTEGYAAMAKYLDYAARHSPNHIAWANLGDWVEEGSLISARTPPKLADTAVYYHHADIMRRVATLLGKTDDVKKYADLAEAIRQSFHRQFFDSATGLYAKDSQTAQALPLYFGMTPEGDRPLATQQLLKNIRDDRKNHVSSGIVGTLYLFYLLMELDRNDVAYAMAVQEDYPGWGNMLRNGATTVWEQWNGTSSLDHPAFGSIDAWFYQALAGIRPDPDSPGFKRIIIKPAVVGDLTWAKASYNSMHGTIVSDWKREGNRLSLHVVIPPNTTAAVYLPASRVSAVAEGGQPVSSAADVNRIVLEGKHAVIHVDSGSFTFSSTMD